MRFTLIVKSPAVVYIPLLFIIGVGLNGKHRTSTSCYCLGVSTCISVRPFIQSPTTFLPLNWRETGLIGGLLDG